ncbi:aldehyde dehydrogenase family protein [Nocardia sp. NPDC055321]
MSASTRDVPASVDLIEVDNPATGEMIGTIEDMNAAQVAQLVSTARAAQPGWEAIGFAQRAKHLRALRSWFVARREQIIDLVVAENGKTREDALLAELYYVADSMGFWAKNAGKYLAKTSPHKHSPLMLGKKVIVRHRPLGVVGVIAPWNYPLTLGIGDALPALMAGNSVIVKPSEITPLAVQFVIEGALEAGFPAGVLQIATGAGATGAALVDTVDMIQFTGSTRTGRRIAARCGERLIPCSVELGGKDPMIVLADANLDRAVNVAVEWALRNSGQLCMSVERIYVEEPIYDEFVVKVTEKVSSLRQGVPGPFGSIDIGAITSAPQLDIIERHVEDAVHKGASILAGGRRVPGHGQFFEPTVLVDVDHTMACMTEETFGPLLPIMRVNDATEAVRLANDSPYGLGSSIFTRDIAKAKQLARQLTAGNTWINDAVMSYLVQEAPFAGARESGLGGRHGAAGIHKYCDTHTTLITRFAPAHEPTMFPNSAGRTRLFDKLLRLMFGR